MFRLLQAARGERVDCTPAWFMRQAGRYLPAYRKLRERHPILEMCAEPELAAAAAMTAVDALPGLDGAIVFSDILQILIPMGIQVEFVAGEGPRIANPVRTAEDIAALRPVDPGSDLRGPLGAIEILRRGLENRMPVIGFAGAPFTLATYMIEGGPSKDYALTKTLMATEPRAWGALMMKLGDAVAAHLRAQANAGASIVQVFDSWAGALGVDDYRESVLPYSKRVFDALKGHVPSIHFGTGTAALLELMRDAGGDVIGLDWRVDLDAGWQAVGHDVGVHDGFLRAGDADQFDSASSTEPAGPSHPGGVDDPETPPVPGQHRVNRRLHAAVGAVLETDGHRQPGGQLADRSDADLAARPLGGQAMDVGVHAAIDLPAGEAAATRPLARIRVEAEQPGRQVEGAPLADGAGPSNWHRFSHTPGKVWGGDTGDKGYSKYHNAPGYVATPSGAMKRYDPATDTVTTLPQTAPTK